MEPGNRKILVYLPAHVWLGAVVTVLLLLVAAYLVFDRGKLYAGAELVDLRKQRKEQVRTIDKQERRIVELSEQVAVLQRSSEIDRRASQEVRNEFSALQDELQALRKELDFYRGIMSPGDAKPGLRVQKFEVKPAHQVGSYTIGLTLAQVKHNDRYVTGVVELEVEGLENGKSKVLVFSQPGIGDSKALSYKFKYFQRLQGEIWIPADFQPLRVKILIKPKGKGQPAGVEEILDWPT
jgi:hypothetical protein